MWFNCGVEIHLDETCLPEGTLLAAISGGPDSLTLLHLLHVSGFPVTVAHFNHKLRPEADREAAFVAGQARTLNLVCVTGEADVAAYASEHGLSLEEAARKLRYRFLFDQARKLGARAVVTGHTADDQAETILMHFLRGAGLSGLKGMTARTLLVEFDAEIPLVRPILHLWREETEGYCRANDLQPVQDPSNADITYFRNRLRHELIPTLQAYNPRVKDALLRSAQALQGDHELLTDVLDAAWRASLRGQGDGYLVFDHSTLAYISMPLRKNLLRRAAFLLRPGLRDVDFSALERAASFAETISTGRVDLAGGLYLFQETGQLYLAACEADLPAGDWPQVNGELPVANCELGNGWQLTVEDADFLAGEEWPVDPWSAWLDAGKMSGRLTVRARRDGDRFTPLGMGGQTVKMQDFFVNNKVPKRAREQWTLVCVNDEVAWVPGFRLGHNFRVSGGTKRVMKLVLEKTRADT